LPASNAGKLFPFSATSLFSLLIGWLGTNT
jgi:hypothetical protein